MKQISVIIVGAGMRGMGYAQFAKSCPERVKIVGVAEPRDWHRNKMIEDFDIPAENVFKCWSELAATGKKLADAVLICTQDNLHVAPAVAFANLKYDILLEKPMAPTEEGCRQIVEAAEKNGIIFSVCHVLRYTAFTKKLKEILNQKKIGEIISIQHLEPVGFWHQAHSFVRGNWRNSQESSFMLLAKSCHDMDWLRYVMNKKIDYISSFGSLRHFRKSEQPKGAANTCVECPIHISATCPYSAKKIYFNFFNNGFKSWPVNILTPEVTPENIEKALKEGPYGRCVFACDNDVVDNQVVNMRFIDDSTIGFTMTAFTKHGGRKTTIFGSSGEIYADSRYITIFDFLTEKTETIDTNITDNSILSGHGGGDGGLMDNFIEAVSKQDKSIVLSDAQTSLETHLMAFFAEKARLNNSVEKVC